MATLTKTYLIDSSSNLTSTSPGVANPTEANSAFYSSLGTSTTASFSTITDADGSGSNGSILHTCTGSARTSTSYIQLAGTYADFGLPNPSYVTDIQVTYAYSAGTITSGGSATAGAVELRNSGGTLLDTLITAQSSKTTSDAGAWTTVTGSTVTLSSQDQSSDSIQIRFNNTLVTPTGGSSTASIYYDYIRITFTYYIPENRATTTFNIDSSTDITNIFNTVVTSPVTATFSTVTDADGTGSNGSVLFSLTGQSLTRSNSLELTTTCESLLGVASSSVIRSVKVSYSWQTGTATTGASSTPGAVQLITGGNTTELIASQGSKGANITWTRVTGTDVSVTPFLSSSNLTLKFNNTLVTGSSGGGSATTSLAYDYIVIEVVYDPAFVGTSSGTSSPTGAIGLTFAFIGTSTGTSTVTGNIIQATAVLLNDATTATTGDQQTSWILRYNSDVSSSTAEKSEASRFSNLELKVANGNANNLSPAQAIRFSVNNAAQATANTHSTIIAAVVYPVVTTSIASSFAVVPTLIIRGPPSFATSDIPAPAQNIISNLFAIPFEDITTGGWTPTPLYEQINDGYSPDESDYVSSSFDPSNDIFEVKLSSIAVASNNRSNQRIVYSAYSVNTINSVLTVSLVDGSTVIATWTDNVQSYQPVWVEHFLTQEQMDAISSYSNLRLRFEANI